MQNITVGRYEHAGDWQGWIEPDDLSWIMFVKANGSPVVYLNRDPVTGAVIPSASDVTDEARASGGKYPGERTDGEQSITEPPR